MAVTNTVAYHDMELIVVVKSFIVQARLGAHPGFHSDRLLALPAIITFGCK